MEENIFVNKLKLLYPNYDIRKSKHGERLLINGHVIKGILIDSLFFKRYNNETESIIKSLIDKHISKYGELQGEYYGEDIK